MNTTDNGPASPTPAKLGQTYLGDAVYAQSLPGFPLVLTTGTHDTGSAGNVIMFEPDVLRALLKVLKATYPNEVRGA